MEVESVERDLGQVGDGHRQAPGLRVGMDGGDDLRVDAEAGGDHEDPVLVARLRFTEVERALQRSVEGRRFDVEVADLREVRAFRRALGVEVGLGVGAGALAVGGVGVDRQTFGQ